MNKRLIWDCVKIIEHTLDIIDNDFDEDPNWSTDTMQEALEHLKEQIRK